ncbi:VOC family protein [Acuticoccus mangrovi]|uniref:VOC family protein n=1 Tax=Acuticoccus mangrovi TaxID=2796142 RepID=A0A934IFY8_9HYPH|nr:VOC family protein [Acuticoccus mangrovi]MBJ3775773.1 VOC family protein [Acuticoccus mangrovi]
MPPIQHHHWPGCSTVSPFIVSDRALEIVDFIRTVFDADTLEPPLMRGDGTLSHAVVKIGDTTIMLGDPRDPNSHHKAFLHIYVPDCDETYGRALEAGATSVMEPADHFYGDRAGGVVDIAGNTWWIATHVRSLSRSEIERLARDAEAAG